MADLADFGLFCQWIVILTRPPGVIQRPSAAGRSATESITRSGNTAG